jgi:mitochondrial cardiolipin hydrolase
MNDVADLKTALERTLDDSRMTRGERSALEEILTDPPKSESELALLRSTAFELIRARIQDDRHRQLLDWLEVANRLLLPKVEPQNRIAEACFAPGCLDRLRELVRAAEGSVDICVFTITDDRITTEIIGAKKRGVQVRIISDDDKARDLGSDVVRLGAHGIGVRFDRSEHHMHHKFAIFDQCILTTGSFNWTRSAEAYNHENMVVTDDARLVRPYRQAFEDLWDRL